MVEVHVCEAQAELQQLKMQAMERPVAECKACS